MPNIKESSTHSTEEIHRAKTEALDKYFADSVEEWLGSWDANFIMSIMDWQFKHQRKLTYKQVSKLNEIYSFFEEQGKLSAKAEYKYENYLR